MILSFGVSNYRSFASYAELFLSKRSLKTNHPTDGDWVSATNQAVGLFGANASGKTSLIDAFYELCKLPGYSMRDDRFVRHLHNPHKLYKTEDVEFFLDFVHEDVRYRWELSIGNSGITQESVSASEHRQFKMIFEREGDDIKFGASSDISADAGGFIKQGSTEWVSSVGAWMKAKDSGKYAQAFKWLSRFVRYISPEEQVGAFMPNFVTDLLKDKEWQKLAAPVLRFADVGVGELLLEEQEVPARRRILAERLAEVIREDLGNKDFKGFSVPEQEPILTFQHTAEDGKTFDLELMEESTGTRLWLETALPALFTIYNGGVLVIDEIDSSLHPLLVRQLVGFFDDQELNQKGAQLIFTSHDLTLLGNFPNRAIEMDAAWLCEKKNSLSILKSIDEFKLPTTAYAEKRYMQGAFGAVPLVPESEVRNSFFNLFTNLVEEPVLEEGISE